MRTERNIDALELEALQAFAAAHGRKWRDILASTYWYNARIWTGPKPGMGEALHSLRNDLGPKWLYDYQLPQV